MKKRFWGIAALLLVAAILAGLYFITREAPVQGHKKITVQVLHGDKSEKSFSYATDAQYLGELLIGEGLIAGQESSYGLFIETVDGETADADKQEWWSITKSGEMLTTGADTTVIADGEQYEFTFTIGW